MFEIFLNSLFYCIHSFIFYGKFIEILEEINQLMKA